MNVPEAGESVEIVMIEHDDEKDPDHNHNHIIWGHPASHNLVIHKQYFGS